MKILFVCLGNICRSPMAEFVMRDLCAKKGVTSLQVDSAATSDETEGCGVHRGTRELLAREGIPYGDHRARQIVQADYAKYDRILGMDKANLRNLKAFFGGDPDGKIGLLLEREIADPWYTHNFDVTYRDIREGCEALLEQIQSTEKK